MKRTFVKILLFLICAIPLLCLQGRGWCAELSREVVSFKLSNGMKWLFVRRMQAPVFSGVVMVRVGGADEKEGRTGLAHVFEHMAFKGSSRVGTRDWEKEKPILEEIERVGQQLTEEGRKPSPAPSLIGDLSQRLADLERQADAFRAKNEIWEVMTRNGAADLNAYTSKDLTAYHASMPSTRLALWAQVMAEMVFEPIFREFYTERDVIAEERRSSVENNPDGMMSEEILSRAFLHGPYQWSTIGYEKDIRSLTIADARAFHRQHYVPGNMVGVLVGDLDLGQARGILERTFGSHRPHPVPPTPASPGEEQGDIAASFSFDAEPSLAIAYHKPTLPDPAEYSFDLIESLLCEGSSSRLQRRLVYEKRMADAVACTVGYPGSRLANLFLIWIDPFRRAKSGDIVREVEDQIGRLKEEPVSEEELTSAKKRVTAALVYSLDQNMELAQRLAEFETIFGSWKLLAGYPERIRAVTGPDLQEAAKRYLDDAGRILIERQKGKRRAP